MPENIKLYDFNKNLIGIIKDPKEVKIEKELEFDKQTLSFFVGKTQSVYQEQYLRCFGQEWVIKEVNMVNELKEVVAINNIETLTKTTIANFTTSEVNIASTLTALFNNIPFWTYAISAELAADSVYMTKERTIALIRMSAMDAIASILNTFFLEVKFDTLTQVATFYKKRGENKGTYFSEQLNLVKIETKADTYDLVTRLIPIGKDDLNIASVNAGLVTVDNFQYVSKVLTAYWIDIRYTNPTHLKEDAELRLVELSKPAYSYECTVYDLASAKPEVYTLLSYEIGDTITLLSPTNDIRFDTRILKMVSYPYFPEKNTVELESRKNRFTDIQNELIDSRNTVTQIIQSNGSISMTVIEGLTTKLDDVQSSSRIILLSNEHQSLVCETNGDLSYDSALTTAISCYQGGLRIAAALTGVKLFNYLGAEMTGYESNFVIVNPTNLTDGSVTLSLLEGTNLPFDSGYIEIPVVITYNAVSTTYVKKLWWSKSFKGSDGIPGTPAQFVVVNGEQDFKFGANGSLATNLITNGDFSNGTDGWVGNVVTLSVSNNELTNTLISPSNGSGVWKLVSALSGHVFYFSFWILPKYNTTVKFGYEDVGANADYGLVPNTWNRLSRVEVKSTSNVVSFYHQTNTSSYISGDTFKYKNMLGLDLTEIFGAGNEPTVEYMDSMMAKFENTWFDGTVHLPTPINQMIRLSASLIGGLSGYDWEYYNGSAWTNLSGTQNINEYDLTHDNAAWGVKTSLRIRCLSGTMYDEVNIVKLYDGSDGFNGTDGTDGIDAIVGYLTNESVTIPTAADGTYNVSVLTPVGGTFKVYEGIVDVTTSATFSGTATKNGLTLTIGAATGIYTLTGASWSTDSESFTVTAVYGGVTITKVYKIAKAKAGAAGSAGATLYTWIRYATDAVGTNLSADPTGRPYIGFAYNQASPTPSAIPGDYTWSLIQGSQGIPGTDGTDGTTTYTWLKYADTPTTGMSDSPTGKTYIGLAMNKTTAVESSTYGDYSWSLIKGETGIPGVDAILVSVVPTQQLFVSTDLGASFDPIQINIFPTLQNCAFSRWDYSVDGATYVPITNYALWATATPYVVGNTITQNGIQYTCLSNHTSTVFEDDLVSSPQLWNRLGYGISTINAIAYTLKIAYDAVLFFDGAITYNTITFRLVGLDNSIEYYDATSIARTYNTKQAVEEVQSTVSALDGTMTEVKNEVFYTDGTSKITELTLWKQTTTDFLALIQTGGGANLLWNSVGYRLTSVAKMPFYEWSYYGTGTAVEEANSTFTLNSISKHGMKLTGSGTIAQSRAIIPNKAMTLSARLSKVAVEEMYLILQTNSTIVSGKATGGTTTTLVDSTKTWTINAYANHQLRISAGTGAGQIRVIVSNTATTLTIATSNAFGTTPDTTSEYTIESINDTVTLLNTTDALNGLYTLNIPAATMNETRITVKINTTSATSGLYITDLMLAYGENFTEWQQAAGESYNTNVLIDRKGISVKSITVDSITGVETITGENVMTPYEFAGYYQGVKIFTLNGDVTIVKKLSVETQIELKPVRMVALYSGATPISVDYVWMGED